MATSTAKNRKVSERRRAGINFLMEAEQAKQWAPILGMDVQALQIRIDALMKRGYTEKASARLCETVYCPRLVALWRTKAGV